MLFQAGKCDGSEFNFCHHGNFRRENQRFSKEIGPADVNISQLLVSKKLDPVFNVTMSLILSYAKNKETKLMQTTVASHQM